ncbi:MAG: 50S ribosomal protein L9 [Bacteroidetes bacterium]|jgi:large subunit ribosomal protein L9|nr:50S ribosomal protein L9 [Bacteroidota bacterium]MBP7256988.1 50S ribosomal protein L9 [Chitinophagales bacterium]MBK7137570.1 50S ribosomal protein L9 [Bacteroidota bacterium]MBK7505141.1 50S ribosomal protein L9 [Bacteroidota bacterium]MBK7639413.1 50S ribosomal protein L9 [Bacteroidota bacterium]
MDIILLQDVENLGSKFDVVKVKAGYGRNFLLPKGMAKVANSSNVKHLEEIRKQQSAKIAKKMEDMQKIADQLKDKVLQIGAKAGTSGKLFGSVTTIQIADALKSQFDLDVDRKKIHLAEEIKNLGTYKATVNLFKEIVADINFEVIQD